MKVFEIVAVYDNLTEAYLEPHFFGTLAEAQRVFIHQINNIPLWKDNAGDYELHSIGRFDMETGVIISDKPHKIMNGRAGVRKEQVNDLQSAESTESGSDA